MRQFRFSHDNCSIVRIRKLARDDEPDATVDAAPLRIHASIDSSGSLKKTEAETILPQG
jgi:hypothetical protein